MPAAAELRWIALAAGSLVVASFAFAGDDLEPLADLHERRLFGEAEQLCRKKLAANDLKDSERADLVVELIQTLALHALDSPGAERERLWQQIEAEVAAFRRRQPPSLRLILVEVQGALAALAKGELARQEIEASPRNREVQAAAQSELRAAIKQLQLLRDEAARLLRIRNRQGAGSAAELSANELLGVQQQLQYQLGRAHRSLSETFPPDSLDAISMLQQAIDAWKPLSESESKHPLVWQAKLGDIACRRVLKDKTAGDRLAALRGAEPPLPIQQAALAEGIRLAMATIDLPLASKWAEEGEKISAAAPDFDLARLELQVALIRDATMRKQEPDIRREQDKAAKIAAAIEERHGAYWSRRAQTLLASIAASGKPSNVDILAAAAAQHLRFGRLPEAVASYDQASAQARASQQSDRAFSLAWAAASIEYQEQHWPEAQQRFRRLAATFPGNAQAAEAHWNAIVSAAMQARDKSSTSLDSYVALLEDHLTRWPNGATADKARWWLGQSRQSRRRWREAADAFRGVSANFAEYPIAIRRWGECLENSLIEQAANGKPIAELLSQAIGDLETRYLEKDGRLPAKWNSARGEAVVAAARWRLRWMPGNAEKSVEQLSAFAQANQDPASAARRWLIAALAASGKVAEANRQLQEARGGNAAEWLAIARQLVETSRPAAAEAQASLAELRLGALHRIDADSPELTATERLFVRREQAQGLLDAGQRAEGLAAWEKLAKSRPEDGALQQQFAEALEGSSDPATAEKALAQWRLVFARSAGRSELWYRANLGIATSLHRLGRKGEARELIELLIARPPGLEKTARKKEFLELLRRSSE